MLVGAVPNEGPFTKRPEIVYGDEARAAVALPSSAHTHLPHPPTPPTHPTHPHTPCKQGTHSSILCYKS